MMSIPISGNTKNWRLEGRHIFDGNVHIAAFDHEQDALVVLALVEKHQQLVADVERLHKIEDAARMWERNELGGHVALVSALENNPRPGDDQ